ncbi:MAG TPA: YdcH family protein [Xanthomonadales bacterium]|nr:YdcH family protein [Xanthomonadales bacterium]
MFEHRKDQLETLLKENKEFLNVYNKHQELDERVTAAELGTAPMDDMALHKLKKEKLFAKDQLARMMDSHA